MSTSTRMRTSIALLISVAFVVAIATPASAEFVSRPCDGQCGTYEITDKTTEGSEGAICRYRNDLQSINVRPPRMYGRYFSYTTVGWRFFVNTSGFPPFRSRWQKAPASNAEPADLGRGFSRRSWTAPNYVSGQYDVVIEMAWWSSNNVRTGTVKVVPEVFQWRRSGNIIAQASWCEAYPD